MLLSFTDVKEQHRIKVLRGIARGCKAVTPDGTKKFASNGFRYTNDDVKSARRLLKEDGAEG